jgi:broad specificity phosphatase PhoE
MTEVWFIRHSESAANAGLATANPAEIPLTDRGHEQARKVSEAFDRAPDLIVTSRYRRAIETAHYTMARFPSAPVESWDTHEFNYLSLMGPSTYAERIPVSRAYWDKFDPTFVHGEGAESFVQFVERVRIMHENIQRRKDQFQFIAIFGHGFLMKVTLWAQLIGSFEVTSEYMQRFHAYNKTFEIENGTIIKAEYKTDTVLLSGLLTNHLGI